MPDSIGDLLSRFFAGQLGDKAPAEARLRETWLRIVGPEIATATSRISLRRRSCLIYVRDPVLREELRYQVPRLLELLRAAGFAELQRLDILSG